MFNIKFVQEFYVEKIPVKLQHDTCNSWGVIAFKRQLDLYTSVKAQKCHTKVNVKPSPRLWCGGHPCKVITWHMQILRSYHFHKAFWLRARMKVQKGCTKSTSNLVKIFIWKTSFPVKLQYDAGKFWGVIYLAIKHKQHYIGSQTTNQA